MARHFFIGFEARDELDLFEANYELLQPGLGARFRQQVIKSLERIRIQPLMYAKYRGRYRLADVRKFPFAVVYVVSRREVNVVSFIPTRSNPANWFRRQRR